MAERAAASQTPGTIPYESLQIGALVAQTADAATHRATLGGKDYALKLFSRSAQLKPRFRTAFALLAHRSALLDGGSHLQPAVLQVCQAQHYGLLAPWFVRGSLTDYLAFVRRRSASPDGLIPWPVRWSWATQLAQALQHMYAQSPPAVHGNVKSSNVLVDDSLALLLADPGLPSFGDEQGGDGAVDGPLFLSPARSAAWSAPETLLGAPATEKSDAYSYGMVLCEIANLKVPFDGLSPERLREIVCDAAERPDVKPSCPALFAKLIDMCWDQDPAERPSFTEIVNFLEQHREALLWQEAPNAEKFLTSRIASSASKPAAASTSSPAAASSSRPVARTSPAPGTTPSPGSRSRSSSSSKGAKAPVLGALEEKLSQIKKVRQADAELQQDQSLQQPPAASSTSSSPIPTGTGGGFSWDDFEDENAVPVQKSTSTPQGSGKSAGGDGRPPPAPLTVPGTTVDEETLLALAMPVSNEQPPRMQVNPRTVTPRSSASSVSSMPSELSDFEDESSELLDLPTFVVTPGKGSSVMQCCVKRVQDGKHSAYELCLERPGQHGGLKTLLTAVEVKTRKAIEIAILIPNSGGVPLGMLRSNFVRNHFKFEENMAHPSNSRRRGLAIRYISTSPRTIKVQAEHSDGKNASAGINLRNKEPEFDRTTGAYTLDFNNRVTMKSLKNFQLCPVTNPASVTLQFGKLSKHMYILDWRAPLSPLTAFAIVLPAFYAITV